MIITAIRTAEKTGKYKLNPSFETKGSNGIRGSLGFKFQTKVITKNTPAKIEKDLIT